MPQKQAKQKSRLHDQTVKQFISDFQKAAEKEPKLLKCLSFENMKHAVKFVLLESTLIYRSNYCYYLINITFIFSVFLYYYYYYYLFLLLLSYCYSYYYYYYYQLLLLLIMIIIIIITILLLLLLLLSSYQLLLFSGTRAIVYSRRWIAFSRFLYSLVSQQVKYHALLCDCLFIYLILSSDIIQYH
jgi:hypothetical protein